MLPVVQLLLTLAPGPLAIPLDPASPLQDPPGAQAQPAQVDEMEIFNPLYDRFINAVGGYNFEKRELQKKGMPSSELPPHPVFEYYPIFQTLAEDGNGAASLWLIRFAGEFHEDVSERRRVTEEHFTILARDHAGGPYMSEGIDDLVARRDLVPEEFMLETLHAIQENAGIAAIEAKALLAEADILSSGPNRGDEVKKARAVDIWRILVDGYGGTKAAKLAGTPLFNRLLAEMRGETHRWCAEVRAIRQQGGHEEEWPLLPILGYRGRVDAIALARHPLAARWSNKFFPALEQFSREGIGQALGAYSAWIPRQFGSSNQAWLTVKNDVDALIFEAFPNDPLVFELLLEIDKRALLTNVEGLRPILEGLIERATSEPNRFQAMHSLATLLRNGTTSEELQTSLLLYHDVGENAPSERLRKSGEQNYRRLSWLMPGAVFPKIEPKDDDGLRVDMDGFRGRVLLAYFWDYNDPDCLVDLPWMGAFVERQAGLPFAMLGMNVDTTTLPGFHKRADELGVKWRNELLQRRDGLATTLFDVHQYPSLFLVDAAGKIRGRNLSHEELEAQVAALYAEMGVTLPSAPPAIAAGALRGRVRFDGKYEPRPAKPVSEQSAAGCCPAGEKVDSADRSLQVDAEGGLANVVVTIAIDGALASGLGKTVAIDQVRCRFEPHLVVIPQGATLSIGNSDATTHNVNIRSLRNPSSNKMVQPGGALRLELENPDRFQIKCDMHPWMTSWVVVTDTPHWALSSVDGSFEIPDLPPGKYVATYWHESLGKGVTAEFEILSGSATEIEFALKPKRKRGRQPR